MIASYLVISIVLAWITYKVIKETDMTPTRVSSLVTLISLIFIYLVKDLLSFNYQELAALIFGSTFVGMCSHKIFHHYSILVAAIIYTLIFVIFRPGQLGLGGALGFSAFISIQATWLLQTFFKKISRS
jgi:hypothetical protein